MAVLLAQLGSVLHLGSDDVGHSHHQFERNCRPSNPFVVQFLVVNFSMQDESDTNVTHTSVV